MVCEEGEPCDRRTAYIRQSFVFCRSPLSADEHLKLFRNGSTGLEAHGVCGGNVDGRVHFSGLLGQIEAPIGLVYRCESCCWR